MVDSPTSAGQPPAEPPEPQEPTAEELAVENAGLRALFGHLHPDVDLTAELNNMAVRPDGTAVYVGELAVAGAEVPAAEAGQAEEPAPATAKPASRPAAKARRAPATPDLSKMTDDQLAEHYQKQMQKTWKAA